MWTCVVDYCQASSDTHNIEWKLKSFSSQASYEYPVRTKATIIRRRGQGKIQFKNAPLHLKREKLPALLDIV